MHPIQRPTIEPRTLDNPEAQQLLQDYAEYRVATFPRQGEYHIAHDDPAEYTAPRGELLVALLGDVPVGIGGVRRIDPRTYEVKHVFVKVEARRLGIAAQLMDRLHSFAREQGADRMRLDTNASLTAALSFYVSQGYHHIAAYNHNSNATDWFERLL